jgi:hypothetical protein
MSICVSLVVRAILTRLPLRHISSPHAPPRCVFLGYSADHKGYHFLDLSTNRLIVFRHVVFYEDSFPLAASPSLTGLNFLCESGPTVSTIGTHLTTVGTSLLAPRRPAPEIPPSFEPPMANLPAPAVPPSFLSQVATTAAPPPTTIGPPTRPWPASPVTYVRRAVGAGAVGTRGAPGAALSREVGAGVTGTCGTPGAALSREVRAGATGTRGAPGAAPSQAEGAGTTGTCGTPGPTLSPEVGAGAAGTRGTPGAALCRELGVGAIGPHVTPGAALHWEVGVGATVTRGGPGAALSQEVGAGVVVTRGSPGAALSQEPGTTPPPPPSRPSTRGQGMVVSVTPPDNPHMMITRGKTGFKVVHDHLVLTAVTSLPTPSLIPSFARAALADPH